MSHIINLWGIPFLFALVGSSLFVAIPLFMLKLGVTDPLVLSMAGVAFQFCYIPFCILHSFLAKHIQRRKARAASQYFDYVHSLDSVKLARRLNRFAGESNRVIPVLLECNVSGEESKYGWQVSSTESQSAVLEEFAILADLPFLNIQGLMTMPPFPKHEEDSRPYFLRLRTFRDTLADQFPGIGWNELSMGMSGDYLVAVEERATLLRIGTKIMGMRSY